MSAKQLLATGYKASDVLKRVQLARADAAKLQAAANLTGTLLARVNALKATATPEEVAQLDAELPVLQRGQKDLQAGIDHLNSYAAEAEDVAETANIDIGCAEATPDGAGVTYGCFAPDTSIWMADRSLKPISRIKAGDYVLSRDPKTGEYASKVVTRTFSHKVIQTVEISTSNTEKIECTPSHPFYVLGRGFMQAGTLSPRDALANHLNSLFNVESERKLQANCIVYNFEVQDYHTYFVGKSGFWVHNACGFAPGTGGSALDNMRDGGGHAIRYFRKLGLIPNTGSLASQVAAFRTLVVPILENPTATFDWALGGPGGTACKAFVGYANGQKVVVFVAKEGPYAGTVLSAFEVTAANAIKWGV